jgi:hypothetical protein
MIFVLTFSAMLRGYDWWEPANLLGSTFYGPRGFRTGPSWATYSGYALHIVITGVAGILFAFACGAMERRTRLVLLGTFAGVLWYFLAAAALWSWANPLVPLYALQPDTLLAHAVFGACLSRVGIPLTGTRETGSTGTSSAETEEPAAPKFWAPPPVEAASDVPVSLPPAIAQAAEPPAAPLPDPLTQDDLGSPQTGEFDNPVLRETSSRETHSPD